ncbi:MULTISPECIES: LuxR C-terminal-related transcriptional regulator [unclassified Brenneria]|uniref:LuxR C-terminal-related transcriptional regulator n=1 Tax=unclassified Brenneria TaxID=2634434 RepID=UPI0029C535CE|nr:MULTISPECIES: LuxR C-terminal-related transcriptional regulator [unclassified Brenneria]MDX5628699.1 LuxR C-terminal-related transcriptional regulator [Brenneria sp. L3-3Z]MDX5695838.1 LuxR C-terminal-related transcriptional regulator [Brenneria sp. L4-2C]
MNENLLYPTLTSAIDYRQKSFTLSHGLPLIATKLSPPRTSGAVLRRDRLLSHLDRIHQLSLALVCAGAGFGKTTLLSQWQQDMIAQGYCVAWLSLDEQDNALHDFRRYLLAALHPYCGALFSQLEPIAPGASLCTEDGFIRNLINSLSQRQTPLYLVIDDFHLIRNPVILQDINELVNYAPACLHLLLGSRSLPTLPLMRMLAGNQMVMIDINDLRFNPAEILAYFAETAHQNLDQADIQRLLAITEGWIIGIQVAALSATGSGDTLFQTLEGPAGAKQMARYLQEVVLNPLPPEIQQFLLQTSILNRFTPELCNAVTLRSDGKQMLHFIEQHNLFISPLDQQGGWFRYHSLFAEAQYERLANGPVKIAELHERASNWLAANGYWAEAIRHALAAGKLDNSAAYAAPSAQSLAEEGDLDTLVRWLQQLPLTEGAREERIELQLNLAWALAHYFRFDEAKALLNRLQSGFALHQLSERLRIKWQVISAIAASFAEDIVTSEALARPLLKRVPCGDSWVDGLVCNILSYDYLVQDRYQDVAAVQQHMPSPCAPQDNLFVSVYRAFILGLHHVRQADLRTGEVYYRQALKQAERLTGVDSCGSATLQALLAEIHYEEDNVLLLDSQVAPHLAKIDIFAPPDALLSAYRALVRRALPHDPAQAKVLLEHAQQVVIGRGWPRLQGMLLAEQIRVAVLQNQRCQARELMGQLTALREKYRRTLPHANYLQTSHLTAQALILMDEGQPGKAASLLWPLVRQLEERRCILEALRLRALCAVAWWREGERQQAADALSPVIKLARSQNLKRSLLDAGAEIHPLLQHMQSRADADERGYIANLLRAAPQIDVGPIADWRPLPPLTERENQTLLLVAQGRSNKEIARSMDISVDTVKWHLKNLYGKLDVTSRTQAMGRAKMLSEADCSE